MSNLHRIQWIDAQIRDHRFPNCSDIASQFCISRRQASRDIEYLRYSLGAPVEYDFTHNGYYYTDEFFSLPSIMIGTEEKQALSYLAEQYGTAGHRLAGRLADLFARLSGRQETGENQNDLPFYNVDIRLISLVNTLREAVDKHYKAELEYINLGQVRSRRVVWPLLLFKRKQRHYLAAWCETREAERTFRLDRICFLTLLEQTFMPLSWFNPQKYGEGVRFNFRLPYTAEIRFDHPILPPVGGNCYTQLTTDIYCITFETSHRLFSELISLNTHFTILSPVWLRKKCYVFFSEILKKNPR